MAGQYCLEIRSSSASLRRRTLHAGAACALVVVALVSLAQAQPCVVPDSGGTVNLPPAGCEYLSPDEVHAIVDGLPPGTTIELAAIHKDFICREQASGGVCSFPPDPALNCDEPGGSLGGEKECANSTLDLQLTGTGTLAGWSRAITLPISFEVHTGPRTPGSPVQDFPADMYRLRGEIAGDPDFDLLRVTGGTNYGLPSPGHTTLTQLPGGTWKVVSFFDITYRIDFAGAPGGPLAGMIGSTTATIHMRTGGCQCPGDLNGDGRVDILDIPPFVTALLTNPPDWCADVNLDGAVNGLDIQPFVNLVLANNGQGTPCYTGACCFSDGSCQDYTASQCTSAGGTQWLAGVLCSTNPCPQPPLGACCQSSGTCAMTTLAQCPAPSIWHPEWTTCTPNPCPPPPTYCIPPGPDCWTTICGPTHYSFAATPLPSGFFDPGSDPFTGVVQLGGAGLGQFGTDTTVQRLGQLCFALPPPALATVPIQLVSLNLVSCVPITVTYSNGPPPEQWNVGVGLSQIMPPPGTMTATMTTPMGGTFDAQFHVQPLFVFTRVNPPYLQHTLDTGTTIPPTPPMQMTSTGVPWRINAPFPTCAPGFFPGVKEDSLGQPCCVETCHVNPNDPSGHLHCVRPPECTHCPP